MYIPDGVGYAFKGTALADAEGHSPHDLPEVAPWQIGQRFEEIAQDYAFADEALPYIGKLIFDKSQILERCLDDPATFITEEVLNLRPVYGQRGIETKHSSSEASVFRMGTRNESRTGIDLDMTVTVVGKETGVKIETNLRNPQQASVSFEVQQDSLVIASSVYDRGVSEPIVFADDSYHRERVLHELADMLLVTNMSLLWSDTETRAPRDRQAKELLARRIRYESVRPAWQNIDDLY